MPRRNGVRNEPTVWMYDKGDEVVVDLGRYRQDFQVAVDQLRADLERDRAHGLGEP